MRDGLIRILTEYASARREPLRDHALARFIRSEFPEAVSREIQDFAGDSTLLVRGTKFMGSWASVPWVSILDPRITSTNQRGVYIVFAFSEDGNRVVLCIGEGVTEVDQETIGRDRRLILEAIRLPSGFETGPLPARTLGESQAAISYEQAMVGYRIYTRDAFPSDEEITADVRGAIGFLDSLAQSPVLPTLSFKRDDNGPTVQWRDYAISVASVEEAFKATTPEDWENRPGYDPYWCVEVDGQVKPLKAVFRRIIGDKENLSFTTHDAARVFRDLGFSVVDTRESKRDATSSRRYWAFAPGRDAKYWGDSRDRGVISIGWDELGDLKQFKSSEEIAAALKRKYEPEGEPTNNALCNWQFSSVMKPGDIVYARRGTRQLLGVGEVTGEYRWDDTREEAKHVRAVRWLRAGEWNLPERTRFGIKTLTDISKSRDFIDLLNQLSGFQEADATIGVTASSTPDAPSVHAVFGVEALSELTGFDTLSLEKWLSRLKRKKQLVLQGPPGTGKTFLADGLSRVVLSGTSGIAQTVQFHPAYAYEDFVQGIRPKLVNGSLGFVLQSGRFLEFCDQASRVDPAPAVLLIDELNRANLSRVFGELMYLLEYRDKSIPLAAGGHFSIPSNVLIIGTMNTADRSIALVDHALRRRFSFVHLGPDYEMLERRLANHGLPASSLVRALRAVNAAIDDRNYEVGVSFFLKDGAQLRTTLQEIWEGEIEPYLEEYFYDRHEKMAAFRFSNVARDLLRDWQL